MTEDARVLSSGFSQCLRTRVRSHPQPGTPHVSQIPILQLVRGTQSQSGQEQPKEHKTSSQVVHVAAGMIAKEKLNSRGLCILQGMH